MRLGAIARGTIDVLIGLLLLMLLVWCAALAWGAYSQHRIAVLVGQGALVEMVSAIEKQTKGEPPQLQAKAQEEIVRLEKAQRDLFDTNTVSFLYQFVTLMILTIGAAVLALMYSQYRREQERAQTADKARLELLAALGPFVSGRETCAVVASKYCLIYTLCQLYLATAGKVKDSAFTMMVSYQDDIHRHLEYLLREKLGLEPLWHEVILDMTKAVGRLLRQIEGAVGEGQDHASVARVLAAWQRCHDILWNNGKKFKDRFNAHWRQMTGQDPPAREWD